jgi:hypothetical protein
MRLTQETIKQIIKEELENVLEENLLQKIKKFFSGDPFEGDIGSYNADRSYEPGTYGAFMSAGQIVGIFKKKNLQMRNKNLSAAVEGMLGAGESDTSGVLGFAAAMAGLVASGVIAVGLGVAGATLGVISLVKLFRKDTTIAEKYPALSDLAMDTELIKLIDDDLEAKIIEAYQKDFVDGVRNNPSEKLKNINIFARNWLKDTLNNRTVTGAPSLTDKA